VDRKTLNFASWQVGANLSKLGYRTKTRAGRNAWKQILQEQPARVPHDVVLCVI
jgi:hypothetical protein